MRGLVGTLTKKAYEPLQKRRLFLWRQSAKGFRVVFYAFAREWARRTWLLAATAQNKLSVTM